MGSTVGNDTIWKIRTFTNASMQYIIYSEKSGHVRNSTNIFDLDISSKVTQNGISG